MQIILLPTWSRRRTTPPCVEKPISYQGEKSILVSC